jgi:hypothetical protein
MDSIGNMEKRRRAQMMYIHRVAESDPQQAESLVREMDLSDDERQQLQDAINMIRSYR